jgi:hypothetical protein
VRSITAKEKGKNRFWKERCNDRSRDRTTLLNSILARFGENNKRHVKNIRNFRAGEERTSDARVLQVIDDIKYVGST